MSLVEIITIIIKASVNAGTPIILVALGEIITERAGVLNLGQEGMMLLGALTGFYFSFISGNPVIGIIFAVIITSLFSSIHAFTAIILRANQVVSGLAITILGAGMASFLGKNLVGTTAPCFKTFSIPFFSSIPVIGQGFFSLNCIVYVSYILIPITGFFLFFTGSGLKLRICGENPSCADTSGISVMKYRFIATLFGGAMAGLGGAYLSLADTPSWMDQMTAGRGWIAIAMVIFSGWNPFLLLVFGYVFGSMVAIQFRIQAFGLDIPVYFLKMLPYLFTLLTLILASTGRFRHRFGAPSALGRPYHREERE